MGADHSLTGGTATGVDTQSLMTQSLQLPVLVGKDTPG
jgi:hypothetical protein